MGVCQLSARPVKTVIDIQYSCLSVWSVLDFSLTYVPWVLTKVCVCVCVCVCACVRDHTRARVREYVYMCVRAREREREK